MTLGGASDGDDCYTNEASRIYRVKSCGALRSEIFELRKKQEKE